MPGDATLGAVLRELREARGLTMTVVARQARCVLSLLSCVESGERTLQPWLAQELDRIYATGSVVASLARAYANAGQPEDACRVAWETLDAMERIDSQSARSELRRALPVLDRWHGRSDVQEVVHRLGV